MTGNNRSSKLGWLKLIGSCDSGSALVETALTVPLIIVLLLGAVEMGDFAYRATEVTNAARAAAQYAAMNGGNFQDTSGMLLAAQQDAPRTNATCTSFAVTPTSSCVCSDGTSCGAVPYSCSSGKTVVTVSVTTSAKCSPITSVPGLGGTFTLYGFAQQEVLQ